MYCDIAEGKRGSKCSACGYTLSADLPSAPIRECTGKIPPKLGDRTEAALKKLGVTQDRYKAAKEKFGLAPTCGCDARKQWLNKVSDWWRSL